MRSKLSIPIPIWIRVKVGIFVWIVSFSLFRYLLANGFAHDLLFFFLIIEHVVYTKRFWWRETCWSTWKLLLLNPFLLFRSILSMFRNQWWISFHYLIPTKTQVSPSILFILHILTDLTINPLRRWIESWFGGSSLSLWSEHWSLPRS